MARNSGSRPAPWGTLGRLLVVLLAAGVLTAGLLLPYVGGLGLAARHEAQKFIDTSCNLQELPPPQKTTLFASDGKTVIATLFTQDRQPVPLSQVPQPLQDALVATEDRRFYSHHGVDMRGLIRSAVSTSGGDTQGGSTLTMQYVKQIRYYEAGKDIAKQQAAIDQNLNRKIEDAKCALFLENTKHESKSDILDNYLNIAFFGENSYGIETAAETYFGKHTQDLSMPESAMLVGLLRAPTEYDPFQHPEAAKARRNQVLQNLVDVHKLGQAQADAYAKTPISLASSKPPVVRQGCANSTGKIINVAFFCDYVVNWLENVGGITDTQLTTGGLKIVTTLDAPLQNAMQTRLFNTIPATSPMASVMPVVDPKTGNVLAMATSKHYGNVTSTKDNTHTVLPIFTEYAAQGASTYKLFPLLTALSIGVPNNWPLETPTGTGGYVPLNCSTGDGTFNNDAAESFSRNETLASATAKSSNTYFVGLADQLLNCDLGTIIDMASKLGIKGLQQPSGDGTMSVAQSITTFQRPAELVLGDIGTSPLEMAGAYAAVANGGRFNAPAPVISITDETNTQLTVKRAPAVQVVSPQVAAQATQILTGDTVYPGTSASQFSGWYGSGGSQVAGKTGTSVAVLPNGQTSENASLWFVGMTPNLVATSALINLDHPNAPAAGLPGVADPGTGAYGAYSAGVWLSALGPTLATQHWSWPDPNSPSFGDAVPPVIGQTLGAAKATLSAAGFNIAQLDAANGLRCASKQPSGTVAFAGPTLATRGSTILVCLSSGTGQTIYTAPRTTAPPTRSPTRGVPTRGGTTVTISPPGRGRGTTIVIPPPTTATPTPTH